MPTQVELSEDGRYVLVTQDGPILVSEIKAARADSRPLYMKDCDRALVDCRLATISHLTFLDIDNLGISFKQDVPNCIRMAIVRASKVDFDRFTHLANTHYLSGIEVELFETMETAKTWLLEDD